MKETLKHMDWALLREQKLWLFHNDSIEAAGLLSLVDAIQDAAVAEGIATEKEVFGEIPTKTQ